MVDLCDVGHSCPATPVLAITLTLVGIERLTGAGIFDPKLGGIRLIPTPVLVLPHPAVYIMTLPEWSCHELITTRTRRRVRIRPWQGNYCNCSDRFLVGDITCLWPGNHPTRA